MKWKTKDGKIINIPINACDVQLLDVENKFKHKNLEDAMQEVGSGTEENMLRIEGKVGKLEEDKTNILKTIGQVNVETDGDIAKQLKEKANLKDVKIFSSLSDIGLTLNDMTTNFSDNVLKIIKAMGKNRRISLYPYQTESNTSLYNSVKNWCGLDTDAYHINIDTSFNGSENLPNKIEVIPNYNNGNNRVFWGFFDNQLGNCREIQFVDDTGWIDLPLIPPLVGYSSNVIPKYRKINNIVEVRGAIKGLKTLDATNGFNFSTLPVGFRPKHTIGVVCQGSVLSRWYLTILSNGVLNIDRYSENGSTLKTEFNGLEWLPFQIMFSVD